MAIQQITIIGTGLIGGSFGLAIRALHGGLRVIGCDRAHVVERARKMGAIDAGMEDPAAAIRGSDVVLLATPVGAIIDLIERIGPLMPPQTLLSDAGSTKLEILHRARAVFGAASPSFVGGHPMAGKEHSSIFSAEGSLFRGAPWLLVSTSPEQDLSSGRIGEYRRLLEKIGARIIEMDAERHDRLCAWISHLPQMISTVMAATLVDEFGDDPDMHAIGGRALREMTRIASSPYSMWRDIAHTNSTNIEQALARIEQRLAYIRENLKTPGLKEEFERANQFEMGKTQ